MGLLWPSAAGELRAGLGGGEVAKCRVRLCLHGRPVAISWLSLRPSADRSNYTHYSFKPDPKHQHLQALQPACRQHEFLFACFSFQ